MPDVMNLSWEARNQLRAYPLSPWCVPIDTSVSFTLPEDFLVELILPISAGLTIDQTKFYISSVASYPSGYSLTVSYAGTGPATTVATATISTAALVASEFVQVPLFGVGDFADTLGRVVFGSQNGILLQPPGLFAFTLATTQLDLDCIQPQLRGVSSISITNGSETLGPFYGDIAFAAGQNFQLDYSPGSVQLSAISGAGLSAACACDSNPSPATPITSINGVPASQANNFTLIGDACISVSQVAGGFSLKDACSQPCCGPAELAAIAAELATFASEVQTLRQFIAGLQAAQAATNSALLGSKIGDQGCITCS